MRLNVAGPIPANFVEPMCRCRLDVSAAPHGFIVQASDKIVRIVCRDCMKRPVTCMSALKAMVWNPPARPRQGVHRPKNVCIGTGLPLFFRLFRRDPKGN